MTLNVIKRKAFCFNNDSNGGEALTVTSTYYDNGDAAKGLTPGYFVNQEIELQSYGNAAAISLFAYMLNPTKLRQLADELEKCEIQIKEIQGG